MTNLKSFFSYLASIHKNSVQKHIKPFVDTNFELDIDIFQNPNI